LPSAQGLKMDSSFGGWSVCFYGIIGSRGIFFPVNSDA
jgi:hypothetical protein